MHLMQADPDFDTLTAPTRNGEALIVPPAAEWESLIAHNRDLRRGYALRIAGRPAAEWLAARHDASPLLLTGHQPEWFHPGASAKNVAAARVAARLGGRASVLIVEHDVPHASAVRRPVLRDGRLDAVAWRPPWPMPGQTYEQQADIDPAAWGAALREARAADAPGLSVFFERFLSGNGGDYVARWAAGIEALDRWLGVDFPAFFRSRTLSRLNGVSSLSWGDFVRHLIAQHEALASAYNAALAEYRAARNIRGLRHPIPDLAVSPDRVELPLWAYRSFGPRHRIYAARQRDAVVVLAGDESIARGADIDAVSADGELAGWRIRPRALTLTMYARLFVCDLFIHGLGGAKYDIIADGLIRRFFECPPPAYACVTATLHLPLPRRPAAESDVHAAARRLRDARFNPQRLLADEAAGGDTRMRQRLAGLTERRTALIEQNDRLRREARHDHAARRATFEAIGQTNAAIAALSPGLEQRVAAALEAARDAARHNQIADARDWFYALYPRESLLSLAERLV